MTSISCGPGHRALPAKTLRSARGVPIALADHATVGLEARIGSLKLGAVAFGSRGRGLGEIDPDPAAGNSFRFGRARVQGLELQVGGGEIGKETSWLASYTVSRSDRDFGQGWNRWALDRTHQLRLFGRTAVSASLSLAAEIACPAPSVREQVDFRLRLAALITELRAEFAHRPVLLALLDQWSRDGAHLDRLPGKPFSAHVLRVAARRILRRSPDLRLRKPARNKR